MRVLLTGASSFTGSWFVRALAAAGHEVAATFRSPLGAYEGLRAGRVREVARVAEVVEETAFGDDRFLDVLPAGVAKGPTLNRLIDELGFDRDRVLVAGDTLNDLSLFETGLKGVAVGNAEPRLLASVAARANVYCSTLPGAAGISDALMHYGFDEETTSAGALP